LLMLYGANAPCKGCQREIKAIGCHSKCEEYIAFTERAKKAREERVRNYALDNYTSQEKTKIAKDMERRKLK